MGPSEDSVEWVADDGDGMPPRVVWSVSAWRMAVMTYARSLADPDMWQTRVARVSRCTRAWETFPDTHSHAPSTHQVYHPHLTHPYSRPALPFPSAPLIGQQKQPVRIASCPDKS